MSRFGPSLQIATQPQRPLPDKEILWGSQDGGCNRFPEKDAISERRYSDNPMPLLAFGRAVSEALDRVWIVDEYLLMPDEKKGDSVEQVKHRVLRRIEKIVEWMQPELVASDIRFLTKHHAEVFEAGALERLQERAQEINARSARRPMKCTIEVRTHLTQKFNYIHDRFAIIDDELWHFGGTAGGFHASVSAASRGWRATDHGAIQFFEMAWNAGEQK
ncbi:hypothetical protein ACFDAU_11990 [Sulfuriferula sp. GW1]|uniref:hypothetical protein n=1 Tax=Sulfuriferula sp. GW1 TaxID=3345111 RepID=UPI0039B03A01